MRRHRCRGGSGLTLNRAFVAALVVAVLATASLLTLRPFIGGIAFAPDQGFNWYYWKRPDPDLASRASAWAGYLAHQVFLWAVIWWAKANRERWRDRAAMHAVNWIALGGTAAFVLLHYAQTALFYDGLGQDVAVIWSQGSVVLLLVVVLLIEAPRRGLFLGAGRGWFASARPALIRYHGYYFAWATVFTFWYHPMELTAGHLLGFFYMFVLFIQAGFVFTRIHTNRYWTVFLEIMVLIHGVTVALVAGQAFWTMFAFGFLFLFVMTQMHGLGLSRRLRWGLAGLAIAALIWAYSLRGWDNLTEVIRIPLIDYGLVFVIGGLVLALARLTRPR